MTLHAGRMFQFWIGGELGGEAQAIRVGETHSGSFNTARREFC